MMHSCLLFALGGSELLILALIVILLFSSHKIPEIMKGLGKGVGLFKQCASHSETSKKHDASAHTPLKDDGKTVSGHTDSGESA